MALLIAALLGGCGGQAQPPDLDAPPTVREIRSLGPDANDEYFLTAWRKCTQWYSDDTCRRQIYGGDDAME
ncbi:MAG: hypothetical protein IPM60_10895 [Rhodospirillales bacterium]|nr:hypothetical protein [Rhodospirillales bacterium]